MLIGGIQKTTFIDYPGKIAATIFTQGCPFRCHYCHNEQLVVKSKFQKPIAENEILDFLASRIGKLDGIVISGGEPTMQSDLFFFIEKIKKLGFCVKLDTSGIDPDMLSLLLQKKMLDYVAMDLKAPLKNYFKIIGKKIDLQRINRSIELLLNSSILYEFRTTLVSSLHSKEDIIEMAKMIKGANLLVLQKFIPTYVLNPLFKKESTFSDEMLEDLKAQAEQFVKQCLIR